MNPSRYNGASFLGLRGLVFKSHGGADAYGYEWAIRRAFDAAKLDVLARISTTIAALMPESEATSISADSNGAIDLSEHRTA
jgi:glycerol-3-phosphate acyltransferase PlsX